MNFYSLIDGIVKSKPTNVAIKSSAKQVISYRELDQQVSRYALALDALGVCPGDRIIVQVDKSLPSLFLYLACLIDSVTVMYSQCKKRKFKVVVWCALFVMASFDVWC